MKQVILVALALLVGSATASVAAQQTKGIVQSVDPVGGTLQLQSGETFSFDSGSSLLGLLPGERVGVSHDGSRGINAYDPHPANRKGADFN